MITIFLWTINDILIERNLALSSIINAAYI